MMGIDITCAQKPPAGAASSMLEISAAELTNAAHRDIVYRRLVCGARARWRREIIWPRVSHINVSIETG